MKNVGQGSLQERLGGHAGESRGTSTSDLAIHRMGQALDDGIGQGVARRRFGGRLRCGDWATGSFSCTMGGLAIWRSITLHDSRGPEAHGVVQNYQALSAG